MRTNSLLTYILYALLLGLICLAGWKACELKREKADREAKIMETQNSLGIEDTEADSLGSIHLEDTDATPKTYKDGSKESDTKTALGDGKPATKPAPTTSSTGTEKAKTSEPAVRPVTSSTTTSSPAKKPLVAKTDDLEDEEDAEEETSTKKSTTKRLVAKGGSTSAKYWVVAGSFKVMDNARTEMEKLVKLGFRDAAAVKTTSKGAYGYAVAKRTNNLSEAEATLEICAKCRVTKRLTSRNFEAPALLLFAHRTSPGIFPNEKIRGLFFIDDSSSPSTF